jgi:hypothetical protein
MRYSLDMVRKYAMKLRDWLLGGKPPDAPYASVRQPVRRGPPHLRAGVALEEPPQR